ncbi:hypothetical protein [Methylobacillus sp.]|uniref:hypothetical protein n=1 Tax=Methylobacillus sp. TaxID=56818 RepID=UPI002579F1F1|nr:hypothetical protein [Methylobacillus sp.]
METAIALLAVIAIGAIGVGCGVLITERRITQDIKDYQRFRMNKRVYYAYQTRDKEIEK